MRAAALIDVPTMAAGYQPRPIYRILIQRREACILHARVFKKGELTLPLETCGCDVAAARCQSPVEQHSSDDGTFACEGGHLVAHVQISRVDCAPSQRTRLCYGVQTCIPPVHTSRAFPSPGPPSFPAPLVPLLLVGTPLGPLQPANTTYAARQWLREAVCTCYLAGRPWTRRTRYGGDWQFSSCKRRAVVIVVTLEYEFLVTYRHLCTPWLTSPMAGMSPARRPARRQKRIRPWASQ